MEYTSHRGKKHDSCWKTYRSLVEKYGKHTLYIQTVIHGMMKHVMHWDWTLSPFIIRKKSNGKSQPPSIWKTE